MKKVLRASQASEKKNMKKTIKQNVWGILEIHPPKAYILSWSKLAQLFKASGTDQKGFQQIEKHLTKSTETW